MVSSSRNLLLALSALGTIGSHLTWRLASYNVMIGAAINVCEYGDTCRPGVCVLPD